MDIAITSVHPFNINLLKRKVLMMFPPPLPLASFASTSNSNKQCGRTYLSSKIACKMSL